MNTSISEFERQKPIITMQKLNELSKRITDERIKTEILYKDRIRSLNEILIITNSMPD